MKQGWYWMRTPAMKPYGWTIAYFDGVYLREHRNGATTGGIFREGYGGDFPEVSERLEPPKEKEEEVCSG
jgi:hypothetical protein